MKVLMSAYACEPGKGSEPEVGLRAMLAAAEAHDVWVITRDNNLPSLRRFLADDTRRSRITLVGCDLGTEWRALKRRGHLAMHLYYDAWQRRAGDIAKALDRTEHFDLVHHATFASYWTRLGVVLPGRPLVWGPVGGGVRPPMGLLRVLGVRGALAYATRLAGGEALRHLHRKTSADPAIALVQNSETARRISGIPATVVPNAAGVDLAMPLDPGARSKRIAVVGRLLPWKGGLLSLLTLTHLRCADAELVFYGTGPEERRLREETRRLGLAGRVRFAGAMARDDLLREVAAAGALLHPSLHEEAGLAVAESLSLGTPVVCLDHGGPAELLRWWPDQPATAVPPRGVDATARALAHAVDRWLDAAPPVPAAITPPVRSFREVLLDAYARAAGASDS